MSLKNCACCGELFVTRPQVPNHAFCSKHACQRERRQQSSRLLLYITRFFAISISL